MKKQAKHSAGSVCRLIDEEQAQEKDAKVQEAVKRPVSIRGKKILLVEDNELNMEIAEFLLRKEGARS